MSKVHIILAQNKKNKADFNYIRYVFFISISIFLKCKKAITHIISAQSFIENNTDIFLGPKIAETRNNLAQILEKIRPISS
jgi:hypothetical protein